MATQAGWATVGAGEWPHETRRAIIWKACGPLAGRAVLVVPPGPSSGWSVLREARVAGAMATALCPADRAQEARDAGADAVLDPARHDPTWYRGAWSVIYDPAGRIGFARAARALVEGGVYATGVASLGDRSRALVSRLTGGPRLIRLRA